MIRRKYDSTTHNPDNDSEDDVENFETKIVTIGIVVGILIIITMNGFNEMIKIKYSPTTTIDKPFTILNPVKITLENGEQYKSKNIIIVPIKTEELQ
jgi:hypothetical protein